MEVDARGGIARRLTAGPGSCTLPRLSPDGATVAYVGRDEGDAGSLHDPGRRRSAAAADVPRQRRALRLRLVARRPRDLLHRRRRRAVRQGDGWRSRSAATAAQPRRLPVGHAMSLDVAASGATLLGRNNLDPGALETLSRRNRRPPVGRSRRQRNVRAARPRAQRQPRVADVGRRARLLPLRPRGDRQPLLGAARRHATCSGYTDEREYFARYPATDGTRIVYACGGEIVLLDPRDSAPRRVAIETPSAAPQTARRFVDAADLLETLHALARRQSAGAGLARPRVHDAAVGSGGQRSTAASRSRAGARSCGCTTARASPTSTTPPASSASRSRAVDQSAPPHYVTDGDVGRITELVASPCGDRLAFANHRHELFVLDLGGAPRKLDTSQAWRCIDLAFSPDGRWLAYVVLAEVEHDDRAHRRLRRRQRRTTRPKRCARTARRRGIPRASTSTSSRRATSTRSTTRCSST